MPPLRASAGRIDITPDPTRALRPFDRSGQSRFVAVHDPLEINAVLLEQGGRLSLLVSVDTLYLDQMVMDAILAQAGGRLDPRGLFAVATHTHATPHLFSDKPGLGVADPLFRAQVADGVAVLVERLLSSPLQPVTITHAAGQGAPVINRRKERWFVSRHGLQKQTRLAPNPQGPKDETLHLLSLRGEEGVLAHLWSFPCHPVGFPHQDQVSADYIGVARRALRQGQAALPVLFLPGFFGNLRPPVYDQNPALYARLNRLLNGPRFGRFSLEGWLSWSEQLALKLASLDQGRPLTGELAYGQAVQPMSSIMTGAGPQETLAAAWISLGSDLLIFGMSCEPVIEWAALLKSRLCPQGTFIPVSCYGHAGGYLPTTPMLAQGGYEACGFFSHFGLSAGRAFKDDLEGRLVAGLAE